MKSNWIKILYILAAVACVIAGVLLQNARLMLFLFPEAQIAILMVTGALFYFNAGYRESGLIVFDALSAPKSGERAHN
jgi:flagellar motor component MotA